MKRRPSRGAEPPVARGEWTEQRVIDELRELYGRGVPLTTQGLCAAGYPRLAHAADYHGGLPRLRRLAGLPPPRGAWQGGVSVEAVREEIEHRYAHRQSLAWSQIPRALQLAAQRHFGSWYAAIVACGLDYDW